MPTYIAQSGATPVPLDTLRTIATQVSFPPDEITSISDVQDVLTLVGYAECTITNAESDITPAWNEKVELGNATLVNGALQASWGAVAMTAAEEADELEILKSDAENTVAEDTDAIRADATSFSSGAGGSDPSVSLKFDTDTLAYLTSVLQAAQNANTGATIRDASGTAVTLTLAQLKYLAASVIETNQDLQEDVVVAKQAIAVATTGTAVATARTTFQTNNPAPTGT